MGGSGGFEEAPQRPKVTKLHEHHETPGDLEIRLSRPAGTAVGLDGAESTQLNELRRSRTVSAPGDAYSRIYGRAKFVPGPVPPVSLNSHQTVGWVTDYYIPRVTLLVDTGETFCKCQIHWPGANGSEFWFDNHPAAKIEFVGV